MIAREFPDFDLGTLPIIPDGFVCTAWHNDTCPTWHEGESLHEPKPGELMLAIDYADKTLREFPESSHDRFSLHIYADNSPTFLVQSDDWAEIETAVTFARYVRLLGLGFHPDTRGDDYINGDGSRTFSDDEATAFDATVEAMFGLGDCYQFSLDIWRALGLITKAEAGR
jgi:hypothetical protein